MKDSLKKEWQSIVSRVPSLRGTRPSPKFLLMGGLLLLASCLCLLFLGRLSLDFDEAVSIAYSQLDWKNFWKALADDPNMSLYYGLLHLWVTLNGTSEFGARSLSVILAVATVPILYSLAARLLGSRAAFISCLLLTLNTFFIQFAQEARSYSLVLFLITLSSLLFIEYVEHPTRVNLVRYSLVSILAVYSHFFAAFVLVAHFAVVFSRPRIIPWKSLMACMLTMGLMLLPLGFLIVFRSASSLLDLSRRCYCAPLSLSNLYSLVYLTGAETWIDKPGGRLLVLIYVILCGMGLITIRYARLFPKKSLRVWHYDFLLAWLVVPTILTIGISIVHPLLRTKYLIVVLPPLVMLAATGISRVRSERLLMGALSVVVILMTRSIFFYYESFDKGDWKAATHYIISHGQPNDALVVYFPWFVRPYEYYVTRFGVRGGPTIVFPSAKTDFELRRDLVAFSESLPSRYPRVWLLFEEDQNGIAMVNSVRASLARKSALEEAKGFFIVRVLLYTRTIQADGLVQPEK